MSLYAKEKRNQAKRFDRANNPNSKSRNKRIEEEKRLIKNYKEKKNA